MPAEGFKGHVATDGSLLGSAGKWGTCGWAVVQLDYDEEMGPLHGVYGSLEAEYEVQRTIKTAEDSFFCASSGKYVDPSRFMWRRRFVPLLVVSLLYSFIVIEKREKSERHLR